MSQTFLSVFIGALALFLPKIGVVVGTEELTGAIQTIVLVVSGIWVLIRRHQQGDVTVLGVRK